MPIIVIHSDSRLTVTVQCDIFFCSDSFIHSWLSVNLVLRATKSHVWESDLLIGLSGIMPHGGISSLVSQAQLIVLRSGLVAVLREKQNARKTKNRNKHSAPTWSLFSPLVPFSTHGPF